MPDRITRDPRRHAGMAPAPRPAPSGPLRAPDDPLLAAAFDTAPVALAVIGPGGRLLHANATLCRLLGYPTEELLGLTYPEFTHPDDVALDDTARARLLRDGGHGPAIEKRFRRADGDYVWVRVTATLLPEGGGAAVVVAEDIGEHRRRDAELSRLALHDPLTGVRNRARLDDDIDRALRARDAAGGVVAVLYLDVDDFKLVNDAHGHDVGDRVLIVLTSRLRDAVREQDTVARLGGDEFVLVAHLPAAAEAAEMRARVLQVCAEPLVLDRAGVLPLRVSVGMALVTGPGQTPAGAIAAADAAMYASKRQRKDPAA